MCYDGGVLVSHVCPVIGCEVVVWGGYPSTPSSWQALFAMQHGGLDMEAQLYAHGLSMIVAVGF